jgi:dynein heavy chain, axonemal
VSVINFTVTFSGLEEQLLADVVKNEKPQIEEKRDENIVNLARYMRKIVESENLILKLLNDSNSETLLDNVELIKTLEVSKVTSEEVKIKIKESIELEKTIEETRNQYKEVSIRGSILYFVIKDLALIDPMYQYSLQYISRLFTLSMRTAVDDHDIKKRLNNLIDNVTRNIYTNVCRGLFEAHKLIYSFLIATSIKRQSGELLEGYWSLFLRGAPVFEKKNQPPNPDKNTISELAWDLAFYLDINFERFKGLSIHISQKYPTWKDYVASAEPVEKDPPGEWKERLNLFERMLVRT